MEIKVTKLIVVQPILASYRKDFFNEISKHFDKTIIFANLQTSNGFQSNVNGDFQKVHAPILGKREKIYYQRGIIKNIIKNKPIAIYLTADFRAIHYYLILLLSKVLNIPIFPHGQGLYDKPNPSFIHRFLFKATISLSSSYICYTQSVYDTLINIGIKSNKLSIMDNTIVNHSPLTFEKKNQENKNKLLYLGRLRKGNNLKLLFEAIKILNTQGFKLSLNIIGDGDEKSELENIAKELNLDIHFLGAIYDDETVSELSKRCIAGVYPGDAGLSVVHYMSLSLIPIVHSDLSKHMGPEPSYIIHGQNGLNFIRNDKDSLARTIKMILEDDSLREKIMKNAFKTYETLSHPTMAEKFMQITKPFLKENE